MATIMNFRLVWKGRIKILKYYGKNTIQTRYTILSHDYSHSSKVSNVSVSFANEAKQISFSTGKLAKFADGCAVVTLGDTSVMATTVSKTEVSSNSFLPLIVDYRQKAAAAGRIPTNFLRRELGPTENEILTSRLIDRSLRPLFSKEYCHDTHIVCNILAIDGINNPDIVAINAASASLAVSDVPWNGPIAAVRVGMIDNELLINPTRREMQKSDLNLIVSATKQNLVVMLDGFANVVSDQHMRKAISSGVKECQTIIHGIEELVKLHGKSKRDFDNTSKIKPEIIESIEALTKIKLCDIFTNYSHDKLSRDKAISNLRTNVLETIKTSVEDANLTASVEAFDIVSKNIFRSLIFEQNTRCDGRKLDEIRKINCEAGLFNPLHGSALFQRGQTQVLCTVTLDSTDSALKLDTISMLTSGVKEKNFFLHYEFPSFATKETGRSGPIGRREMGHGALAERSIRPVLPENYPFTIRLNSEVLESNGSSSMASVCGGSLALLDAGVSITSPVAGVAMGLVTKYKNSDELDYRILTDLLGIEDYLGDMDFKIAGTKKGYTALQLDIKIPGLPMNILTEAMAMAITAKNKIIDIMNGTLSEPRNNKENMPVTEKVTVPAHMRGKFLGIGGSNLKKLFIETGVSVHAEDELNYIMFAPNETALKEAREIINSKLLEENIPNLEFGGIYTAKIVDIRENGVMIILYPTMIPALLHNSQLDQRSVMHPSALGLNVGDELQVKYFGRDPVSGTMRLSRRALQTVSPTRAKNFTTPRNTANAADDNSKNF